MHDSPQWGRLCTLVGPVRGDQAADQLLARYRLAQLELQALALQGQEPTPEQAAALQALEQQVESIAHLREYLAAEQAYGALLGQLRAILAPVFQPDLPGQLRGR